MTAPVIRNTILNYSANQITISGNTFSPDGLMPQIVFNGVALTVVSFSDTAIVAQLPSGLVPGSYSVLLTNSMGIPVSYIVAYGQGPQGPSVVYVTTKFYFGPLIDPYKPIATLTLPAGSYLVQSKTNISTAIPGPSTPGYFPSSNLLILNSPSGPFHSVLDSSLVSDQPATSERPYPYIMISNQAVLTATATTYIGVGCFNPYATEALAHNTVLTAIAVDTIILQ